MHENLFFRINSWRKRRCSVIPANNRLFKIFWGCLTDHVGDQSLTIDGDDEPTDRYIHNRDLMWLQSADVLIAEVSTVSLGVGYEIGRAIKMGKKVLCLFRTNPDRKLSAMISSCPDIVVVQYDNLDQVKNTFQNLLRSIICISIKTCI